jgi:prepilin-type processing-associated H-X9-DG protein
MNPFGYNFAFVDGHCRFYASTKALIGVASGTLDSAEAEQLAREIGLASFAKFDTILIQKCLDGGSAEMGDGVHAFACMCGNCGDSAPAGMADAVNAGQKWIMRLAAEGTLWSGPVSAAAIDFMNPGFGEAPQPWPLATSIDDILVSTTELNGRSGKVFDSVSDAAALRAVRKQHSMLLVPNDYMLVTAGDKQYSLFVRDELPRETKASFARFQAVADNVISVAHGNEPRVFDAGNP